MDSTYVPVPRWQSISSLIFAALFAFVLPFVCWGQLADPSHPHTMAHFVFIDPPTINPEQQALFSLHQHGNLVHAHKAGNATANSIASNQSGNDQAASQILLLFTLPFVLMALFRLSVARQHAVRRVPNQLQSSDWQSPPTSPPPQFTVFLAH